MILGFPLAASIIFNSYVKLPKGTNKKSVPGTSSHPIRHPPTAHVAMSHGEIHRLLRPLPRQPPMGTRSRESPMESK